MTTQSHTNTTPRPHTDRNSLLDKFNLGFEYDKTWIEAKRYTQTSTIKNKR